MSTDSGTSTNNAFPTTPSAAPMTVGQLNPLIDIPFIADARRNTTAQLSDFAFGSMPPAEPSFAFGAPLSSATPQTKRKRMAYDITAASALINGLKERRVAFSAARASFIRDKNAANDETLEEIYETAIHAISKHIASIDNIISPRH